MILKTIMAFYDAAVAALNRGVSLRQVLELPIRDTIAGLKTTPHEKAIQFMQEYTSALAEEVAGIEVL
jgi:V/A-type H+-transporting ATPase subunit A